MHIAVLYTLLVIMGLITGAITGIVGASGVVVVVPILLLLTGVDTHTALGVSLMVDFIASIIVTFTYFRKGNVRLLSGLWMIIGTVAGSQIGVLFAHKIPDSNLGLSFGIGIMVIGIGMIIKGIIDYLKNRKKSTSTDISETPINTDEVVIEDRLEGTVPNTEEITVISSSKFKRKWLEIIVLILLGMVIGLISGLFGAGGGILLIFVCTGVLGLSLHEAIGTSTMVMCITALSGFIGYSIQGSINYMFGLFLAIGSVVGGFISAKIANAINEDILRILFGCINIGLGITTLIIG